MTVAIRTEALVADPVREKEWTGLLGPLTLAVPVVTLVNYAREIAFGHLWAGHFPGNCAGASPVSTGDAGIHAGRGRMTVARTVWRQVEAGDYGLMRRVHRWLAPRPVRVMMIAASRLGDGWLWWALGVALLLFGGPHRFVAISAGAAAAGTGILIFCSLKHTSRRKRPFEIVPHCWANIPPPDRYSFPSGHTITAFAVALSIGHFYPILLMALVGMAVLIAVSRIVLGMHFLSDVLAGSIIGITLGHLSFHIIHLL